MGREPDQAAAGAVGRALASLVAWSSASGRMLDLLADLDAGRVADVVHALADCCEALGKSLVQTKPDGQERPTELVDACETFVQAYQLRERRLTPMGHIGWQTVVDDFAVLRRQYGFSSTRSIETFDELAQYLSRASAALTRVLEGCDRLVAELRETDQPSTPEEWDALAASISERIARWVRTREVLDRTSLAVREVLTRNDDFQKQRRALGERSTVESNVESNDDVARLLAAIARVLSPWAWLVRSADSRLTACEPVGSYRLRLGFADGLVREIELGADYWNTTGLEMDPELFDSVRIDRQRNALVWSNGFADSGERLHLAITEGRLGGAQPADPESENTT